MNVEVTFRHMDSTDAIKEHVQEKVSKFEKFVNYPFKVSVLLSVVKETHEVEITCYVEHKTLIAKAESQDLYESIDKAVSRLESQFRKEREKKKGHHSAHTLARPHSDKLASDVDAEIPHMAKKSGHSQ